MIAFIAEVLKHNRQPKDSELKNAVQKGIVKCP